MQTDKKTKVFAGIYIAILVLTPFLCTFIVELSCNTMPETLRILPIAIEILVCALIELIISGFIPKHSIGLVICYFLAFLFGVSNYYLLKFRDIPLMLMDFLQIRTAAAVAGSYDYSLENRQIISLVITIVAIALILVLDKPFKRFIAPRYRYVKSATVGFFATAGMIILVCFVGFSYGFGIVMNMWKPGLTYAENGAISSFICYAQFSFIRKPQGYSKAKVEEALLNAQKEYDDTHKSIENDKKPTVISIMDESYADLSVLGPLECTREHLDFFYSLKNDPGTIWHGYTYVSTYAGGTARTEYEWLTGYSMRMYPNAQPYSQFNFTNIMTFLDSFLVQGYDAIAMHPEKPSNYRRNTVYDQMGFDRYLSMDDFDGYKMISYMVDRYADEGDFNRMIDETKKNDNPKFIHNVTMQNHGWYDFVLDSRIAAKVDAEYNNVRDFVRYETLLDGSDDALEKLIDYYRESDDPVIICVYGDHLPKLTETFMDELYRKGYNPNLNQVENEERRFKVPFFIWANYDLEESIPGYAKNGELITSTNYLGVVTRADAGLKLSAFDKYLLLLREQIPVINESGYVAGGTWYAADEETKYTKLLDEYEQIQYAGMFDNSGIEYLFGGE